MNTTPRRRSAQPDPQDDSPFSEGPTVTMVQGPYADEGLSTAAKLIALLVLLGGGYALVDLGSNLPWEFRALRNQLGGDEAVASLNLDLNGSMSADTAKALIAAGLEVAKGWAPYLLLTQIPYLLSVAAAALLALVALVAARRAVRQWLVRAALLACVARIAVGVVTFQYADEFLVVSGKIAAGAITRAGPGATLNERAEAARAEATANKAANVVANVTGAMVLVWAVAAAGLWLGAALTFVRRQDASGEDGDPSDSEA